MASGRLNPMGGASDLVSPPLYHLRSGPLWDKTKICLEGVPQDNAGFVQQSLPYLECDSPA